MADWTVNISWASPEEIPGCLGTAEYDPRGMTADVRIVSGLDPCYPDGGTEQTVIHELLHIVMHGDVDYDKENIMQERAINCIADALYWSYRRKNGSKQCKKKK